MMTMMRNKVTRTSSSSRKSFRSENRGGRALRTLFAVRVVRGVFVQQLPAKKTKRDDKRK